MDTSSKLKAKFFLCGSWSTSLDFFLSVLILTFVLGDGAAPLAVDHLFPAELPVAMLELLVLGFPGVAAASIIAATRMRSCHSCCSRSHCSRVMVTAPTTFCKPEALVS